nr:hypothetical protein [Kibdelosporangium sp. MJ126-NF4]
MRIKSLKMVTVGFAVAAGALLSACSGQNAAAPSDPVNAVPQEQAQQMRAGDDVANRSGNTSPAPAHRQGEEGTGSGGVKVDNPDRKFPNTSRIAVLVGYNEQAGMVEFRLQRWVPGGAAEKHLDDVPGDIGTHRLPLADAATVRSALSICPTDQPVVDNEGYGAEKCSRQRLVTTLREGNSVNAKIDVDGADRIARVAEIYTP